MNNYLTEELRNAEPSGGHRLRLTFTDGYSAELDLAPILNWGPIYEAIRNPDVFRQVTVRHGVPEWPGDFDFSPGTLRAWCEAGRVMSLDETDEWVRSHSSPREQAA
jgi:hypothetical protein